MPLIDLTDEECGCVYRRLANYDKAQILVNKFKPAEAPPCSPVEPS